MSIAKATLILLCYLVMRLNNSSAGLQKNIRISKQKQKNTHTKEKKPRKKQKKKPKQNNKKTKLAKTGIKINHTVNYFDISNVYWYAPDLTCHMYITYKILT